MTNYNNQQYGQGEASSYYANAGQEGQQYGQQQQHGQQQQQQQYGQQLDGPDGERGVLGAIAGGVAGGAGGHAIGGKTGYSKSSTIIGAIAGAFAGHKLQDGVSDWKDKRDEDKEHEKHEEEERRRREEEERRRKEEHHRPHENHQQEQQHHHNESRGVHYAGNFSSSSRDTRLDAHGEYMLHASCARLDGSYQASSISLNNIIENSGGSFRWVQPGNHSNNNCGRPATVTVQNGDTLRSIGAQIGAPWEEIAKHNNISNPDMIYPGQVLNVPGGGNGGGHGGGGSVGNFGASARNVHLTDNGSRLEAELLRDGQWVGASIVLDERIGNENGTLSYVN